MLKTSRLLKEINSLEKIAGRFDPNKDYGGTYLTAFYFEDDFGIEHCHCTHKYFGEQPEEVVPLIIQTIDEHFNEYPEQFSQPRLWVFDDFQWFGSEKDTPVLVRSVNDDMLLELRQKLNGFAEDRFPDYKPHITLMDDQEMPHLIARPVAYCLMTGDTMLKQWKIGP